MRSESVLEAIKDETRMPRITHLYPWDEKREQYSNIARCGTRKPADARHGLADGQLCVVCVDLSKGAGRYPG